MNYYRGYVTSLFNGEGQPTGHYYRIDDDGNILHVNMETKCINQLDMFEFIGEKYKEVSEEEFNETLTNTMDKLGINKLSFKF